MRATVRCDTPASARAVSTRAGEAASAPRVVGLQGALDIETVPEVDGFLRRTFGPFYFRHDLVLDLGEVTFADSAFVGFIVALANRIHTEHRELVLARPVGNLRRLLAMVGLPNVVPVFESLEEAVAVLADSRLPVIPPPFRAERRPDRGRESVHEVTV